MILHLVPNYNGLEQSNYVLEYKRLNNVVSCIASTYFYDKPNKYDLNRQISVIIINPSFEIIDNIQRMSDFTQYEKNLTQFLIEKIKISTLPLTGEPDKVTFKYTSVFYKINKFNDQFLLGDLIITKNIIFILNYDEENKKFNVILTIKISKLIKLNSNKNKENIFAIYDSELISDGLEVKSESYLDLLALIDELYKSNR